MRQRRHQAGTPDGGKWAPEGHADAPAGVTLDDGDPAFTGDTFTDADMEDAWASFRELTFDPDDPYRSDAGTGDLSTAGDSELGKVAGF